MATITVKHSINVCDLCGDGTTESSKQVRLGVDRKWFNLDLCSRHAGNVTSKLQEWSTAVGRSVSVAAEKSAANNTTAIREWAKANGHEVNERGRIPRTVVEAYEAAVSGAGGQTPVETEDEPVADKPRAAARKRTARTSD